MKRGHLDTRIQQSVECADWRSVSRLTLERTRYRRYAGQHFVRCANGRIMNRTSDFTKRRQEGVGMNWRTRIVANPEVLVGKPVIKGTRISVELVMDLLAAGYTPQQIVEQYDHLTVDDIHACLAYAREVIHSERVYAVKS
jgi:uncharacterized protein (DUF433 family)